MSNGLPTYLHDHLSGANFALELLQALAEQNVDNDLGMFAVKMRSEVEEDRNVLQGLAEQNGSGGPTLKEATAWLAEKASRFKLAWSKDRELGTFEALEALSLGVLGKLALWRAIQEISANHQGSAGLDFDRLTKRALEQHSQLEKRRLEWAHRALAAR